MNMVINFPATWYSLLFGIVISFNLSCQQDEKCDGGSGSVYEYRLLAPVTISPVDTTYSIGDTISVEIKIPREMVDENHDLPEKILNQNVYHASWVVHLANPDISVDGSIAITYLFDDSMVGDFQLLPSSESFFLAGEFEDIEEQAHIAEVRYRFVLNQVGDYWFKFGGQLPSPESEGPILEIADFCHNGVIDLAYRVNEGANNNFQFLCQPNGDFCGPAHQEQNRTDAFDDRGGFIFRVVE